MKQLISIVFLAFVTACAPKKNDEKAQTAHTTSEQNKHASSASKQTEQTRPPAKTTESFQDFFEKNFVGKSEKGILIGLENARHPPFGIYLLYAAGVNPVLAPYQNTTQMLEALPDLPQNLADLNCTLSEEKFPQPNEDGDFEKKGCFLKNVAQHTLISEKYEEISRLLLLTYEDDELQQAEKADKIISKIVLSTEKGVKMAFGKIEGKWRLILLDFYSYQFGA